MAEFESILPAGWKRAPGWSHGIVVSGGREVHIAGQFGWNPVNQEMVSADFGGQWDQALANIKAVVEAAGGTTRDLVSMRIFVTSLAQYEAAGSELGSAWMTHIGKHFPAMTMVEVSRLTDPAALVEVEALARIAEGGMTGEG